MALSTTVALSEIRELTAPRHTGFVTVFRMNSVVPNLEICCSELIGYFAERIRY